MLMITRTVSSSLLITYSNSNPSGFEGNAAASNTFLANLHESSLYASIILFIGQAAIPQYVNLGCLSLC